MLTYAIIKIGSTQYKVLPGKEILVDFLGEDTKNIEAEVLLLSQDGKTQIGSPILKDKLKFEVLSSEKGKKIRVAKFHAKANYRRVRGYRDIKSRIRLMA